MRELNGDLQARLDAALELAESTEKTLAPLRDRVSELPLANGDLN
jgi:hypothetical protein